MIKLKCLVVDDEPVARKGIGSFINKTQSLELTALAKNTDEATEMLLNYEIDLMFLDIEMPGLDGISYLKQLTLKPAVIIITAYPNFALDGFELNVIDYLLKPVAYERFLKAVNKVRNTVTGAEQSDKQYIFIKSGTAHQRIAVMEIDYIEAKGNYLLFHTETKSVIAYLTMGKAEEILPDDLFLRIHKSYIVNISKVSKMEGNLLFIYSKALPVSRSMKECVISRLAENF